MRLGITGGRLFLVLGLAGALVQACGGESIGPGGGTDGGTGSGGSSSGGAASGSGGAPATGGSKAGSGGISSGGFVGGGGKATGGTIGTGGKATGGTVGSGGKSMGGTTGTGGKATGGTTGTGGSTNSSCQPNAADGECLGCVKTECCQEWLDCGSDVHCSQTSTSDGEILCIQNCLIDAVTQGDVADVSVCALACQHESSGVSPATSDLIACMRTQDANGLQQRCTTPCFGTEL